MAAMLAGPRAAGAAASTSRVPLAKAFTYLEAYLSMPESAHRHFALVYVAQRGRRPAPGVLATIEERNGRRTQLHIGSDGTVGPLPTLSQLRGGATVVIENEDGEVKFGLQIRPTLPTSNQIEIAPLRAALAEANTGIAQMAGPLGFMAPKLEACFFPGGSLGEVVLADGRSIALPTSPSAALGVVPYLIPASLPDARVVHFAAPPASILLGGRPK